MAFRIGFILSAILISFLSSYWLMQGQLSEWMKIFIVMSMIVPIVFYGTWFFLDEFNRRKAVRNTNLVLKTVKKIVSIVQNQVPNIRHVVSAPAFPDGVWHLDITNGTQGVSIEISIPLKIGVTSLPADWGQDCDGYFANAESSTVKIVQLLKKIA